MGEALADVLLRQGVVDEQQLERAQGAAARSGAPLGKALVALRLATDEQIVVALAEQAGVPFVDCGPGRVDPEAARLIDRSLAVELCTLPVAFTRDGALLVATADPDLAGLERVAEETGLPVQGALALRGAIRAAIDSLPDERSAVGGAAGGATSNGVGPVAAPAPGRQALRPPAVPVVPAAPGLGYGLRGSRELPDPLSTEPFPGLLPTGENLSGDRVPEQGIDLHDVLRDVVEAGASDLHLTAGLPPTLRLAGVLMPLDGYPVLTPKVLQGLVYSILTQRQRETFENELELDLSYQPPGSTRFRVNVFQQRDSLGAVLRVIPSEIHTLEELGIPPQVRTFTELPRGFVLVTGPTGSGKSTTLAALIDTINRERAVHIMTVEDPIEFLHGHQRAVVNQRELGGDTRSFGSALKHVLRQDPDVILIGELRDLETIQVALTAAETGHLVFGTLHTQDAPQTIDRVIDVFPPHQQEQIRAMLAGSLQGVVCQQLLKRADGPGRVAACEVMMATPAIRNLIREGKTHQMYSSIQAGKQHGMVSMDQSLAGLVLSGRITYAAAAERCSSLDDFNRLCGRA